MLSRLGSETSTCESEASDSNDSFSSEIIVYGSHKTLYQDFSIIKTLKEDKFPVYLVRSKVTKGYYAMKVFPHKRNRPCLQFINEIRFNCLQHKNINKNLFFEHHADSEIIESNQTGSISYKIMEYAHYGDFLNFLRSYRSQIDDKLIRTYFRQLIEGLDYLHKSNIAHMDIKLENLLISADFSLKIADFDVAHYKEDAIILGNGTKIYRSPELACGKCNNPKASDIYSAGIVLFVLKSGGVFPYTEQESESINLLYNDTQGFWNRHFKTQRKDQRFYDKDFQDLFVMMVKADPQSRASIEGIKRSSWFNGSVYNSEELKEVMEGIISKDEREFSRLLSSTANCK